MLPTLSNCTDGSASPTENAPPTEADGAALAPYWGSGSGGLLRGYRLVERP